MRRLRPHLSFANVCSFLALIVALGTGGAYAANTIGSSDIIDGEVKTADLGANAVTSAKIADGEVTEAGIGQGAVSTAELKNDAVTAQKVLNETLVGNDVAANTLKGADIDESTLAGIGGGGPAGGDLTGTYPNPEIRADRVGSSEVAPDSLTGAVIENQSGVDTCTHATARIGELCFRAGNANRDWDQAIERCANLGLRLPSLAEAKQLAQAHDLPTLDEEERFWTADRYVTDVFVADTVTDGGAWGFADLTAELETVCVTTPTN
jgi:hypothetical protein